MRDYNVELFSECDKKDYYIKRATSSVDLDINKKLTHKINIKADLESDYNIGLIIGNSGSGKTTFVNKHFENIFKNDNYDENECVIKQFPENMEYDERVNLLTSIGLSSVTEWIKPIKILSNGEKARIEIALRLSYNNIIGIDEYTSTVDRVVAKIMSYAIQKYVRKNNKKIICCSVHFDIIEWLNPDWIINMNDQKFIDRRRLWHDYKKKEKLEFKIKECSGKEWKNFSKYHYLSDKMPGGKNYCYGLYLKDKRQIGFQCFTNYNPKIPKMYHSNRTVILPEYSGIGLGIILINETSKIMKKNKFDVRAKFSNYAIYKSMLKSNLWIYLGKNNNMKGGQLRPGKELNHHGRGRQRKFVTTYIFKFKRIIPQ